MKKVLLILLLFSVLASKAVFAGDDADSTGSAGNEDTDVDIQDGFNPEEMYLTFNYAGLISTLLTCYYEGENTYVPVRNFFDILQIVNEREGNVIKGFYLSTDKDFEIDADDKTITFAGKTTRFTGADIFETDGSIYLTPAALEKGFNMEIKVDLSDLTLGLYTNEPPPVVAKAKREQLRDALLEKKKEKVTPLLYKRNKNWFRGQFLDYFFSSSYSEGSTPNQSFSLSSGSEALGGDLNVNLSGSRSNGDGSFNSNINWRYVFGEDKLLNQVLLGTKLQSRGINPHSFKGISLTNAPFDIDDNFGKYVLIDQTIPNSDVELYINNELKAYTVADELGNYRFQIPLTYGSNTVELKIYSPDGQLIENNRRIQVPFDYLPENDWQYYLNFGKQNDSKNLLYHGSLAYGITPWLTNRVGVDIATDGGTRNHVFFNSLSARVMDDYLFNYTAAPELYHRFTLNASYFSLQSFMIRYTKYKENKTFNIRNIKEDVQFAAGLPVNILDTRMGFQVQGLYENIQENQHYKLDVGGNFSLLNFNPSLSYVYSEDKSSTASSIRKEVKLGVSTPAFFFSGIFPELMTGKYFNAVVKYDAVDNAFSNMKLTYSSNITTNSRIEFNYNRDLKNDFSTFNVLFRYEFPFAITNTIADKNSLAMNVHGTLGYDNVNENIFTTKRQSVGTGGVGFRMYHDENGNGRYDREEQIVNDVDLRFEENVPMERKENGILMASELAPYHRYDVKINSQSGKNPFLLPKYEKFALVTDPNQIKLVEVPFYFSQEVNGSVYAVKKGEEIPLPGVKVHIYNYEQDEEKVISSFNDGTLYFLGLLPGKYTAYVDPELIDKLGAEPVPSQIEFVINEDSEDESGLKDLNFLLKLDNSEVIGEIDIEFESFRKRFILTEKKINSRTGTPAEARESHFDEISASKYRALPEFAERYEVMKAKLLEWENEVEEGTDKKSTGYTVVKGDCLWKIAGMKIHYDNPHLWPAIWEANKDGIISAPPGVRQEIVNPNLIYPGQVIKIPMLTDEEKQEFLDIEGEYYDRKGRGKPREQ